MSLTIKKWRRGFALALFLGTLSAFAGGLAGVDWKQFLAILATSQLTSLTAYLMKSPLDAVDDEDERTKQIEANK